MNKLVGVVPLYDEEKDSYWMIPGYMKMLEAYGAIPCILPLTTDSKILDSFFEICDGFLLTGGQDVDPEVYHESVKDTCGIPCKERDAMETYLLKKAVSLNKSVLGICRGVQFMNACFGGSLYQDLPSEYESNVEHHMAPPYDRVVHMVTIQKGTLLEEILGEKIIGVNSYHHQAIKTVAPGFTVNAISEDGIVEAISLDGKKFVLGVQWHPELSYKTDENSQKIIQALIQSL